MEKEIKKEEINFLVNKKIKISYNPTSNEVTRDEGHVYLIDDSFVVLRLYNDKLKWIAKSKIIRMEEI